MSFIFIFCVSSEGLKLDLITILIFILERLIFRINGIIRNGRLMFFVVLYLLLNIEIEVDELYV